MIAEKGSAADGVLELGTNVATQSSGGSEADPGAAAGVPVVGSILGATAVPGAVVDSVLGATDWLGWDLQEIMQDATTNGAITRSGFMTCTTPATGKRAEATARANRYWYRWSPIASPVAAVTRTTKPGPPRTPGVTL